MNHNQIRALSLLIGAAFFAVCIGYSVAVEQYFLLALATCGVIGTILFLMPGYIPLLAFGLLTPFAIPLPFIWGFPPVLFVLLFCFLKKSFREGLARHTNQRINVMIVPFWIFFGWIFIRYCMNPVLPNAAGFGENVTGFRPYLNYGICFALVATLGFFIRVRADISKMIRWMAWVSLFLVLLLVPLMFVRSMGVAAVLQYLGLYVDMYDNGVFRFVVLPFFGIILVSLSLLPELLQIRTTFRWFLLSIGGLAVVLGGSRSGLLMASAVVLVIPLLQRNFRKFTVILVAIGAFFTAAYFVGEKVGRGDAAVLRVLALVSPKVAESTQAAGTWEFREIRWRRAWMEIQNRPLVGRGYGGVENAFIWSNWSNFEDARVEIDIASGGVHNGYIACALIFGIPAALLFIGILAWTIWRNAKMAMRETSDSFSKNIHAFVCVNLIAYALTIYIGTDLNNPMLWFLMALGVLMERVKRAKSSRLPPKEAVVPNRTPLHGALNTGGAGSARAIV
ncbi:MAG: O-antigen ligase family protein [Verrucomicrobia bacterium]|nr:O-antigen ligase family protein [Verrucomicrobiota bacterium]